MKKLWTRIFTCLMTVAAVCLFVVYLLHSDVLPVTAQLPSPVTVVIDAGHGGEDGGTTSVSGVQEKQLNLEIAQRLEDLLSLAGVRTCMLRDTDTALYSGVCSSFSEKKASDLRNRAATINAVPNAIAVSIHQNHFPQEQYFGAQVFYAPSSGSRQLAECLQNAFREHLNPNNTRQAKSAGSVFLMNHIQPTGILVECGFLSNVQEDRLLQSKPYQIKLSAVITGTLLQYIEEGMSANEI